VFKSNDGREIFYDEDVISVPRGRNGIGRFQQGDRRGLDSSVYGDFCVLNVPGRVTAAIFADGSAYGDRKLIAAIESQRLKEERQYLHVEMRLCELLKQGADYAQISAKLKSEQTGYDPAVELVTQALDRTQVLRGRSKIGLNVPAVFRRLSSRRHLAMGEPVRDENGNPYVNDSEADVVCDATEK